MAQDDSLTGDDDLLDRRVVHESLDEFRRTRYPLYAEHGFTFQDAYQVHLLSEVLWELRATNMEDDDGATAE